LNSTEQEITMKTHNLDVTVDPASSTVTVSDPQHFISSGDQVIWTITWVPSLVSGDLLQLELDSDLLTGDSSINATVRAAGHKAGDHLPCMFSLNKRGSSTTRLYLDLITPLAPTATDPCLVLDTSGPPLTGGGTGHCTHGPKGPSRRGGETPDRS
jgi:hypothetical protein